MGVGKVFWNGVFVGKSWLWEGSGGGVLDLMSSIFVVGVESRLVLFNCNVSLIV